MSDAPRLSVVMPMRNCAHCVCAMLDGLRQQNIPLQIVVVDDASEDDGPARVEAWSRQTGQPVELLRNERQLYSYGSRLKGLARAVAPVVWNVDADDRIPPNAGIGDALECMEREGADIVHGRACGVSSGSSLQQPLVWTEPVAERLNGSDIFSAFMARDYPPATLCNKFFSARLVKAVLAAAPAMTVRYFDVKFLGLLFLLHAQSYVACNDLLYEYRMRAHRPSWLYARQADALLLLEQRLTPLVAGQAPEQTPAFREYCRRRLIIQTGHLSLMAEAELRQLLAQRGDPHDWLTQNMLPNLSREGLLTALYRSLAANAARLYGWSEALLRLHGASSDVLAGETCQMAEESLCLAAQEWLCGDFSAKTCCRLARSALHLGRALPTSEPDRHAPGDARFERTALALLLGNARLARAITDIMAPQVDITRKAN